MVGIYGGEQTNQKLAKLEVNRIFDSMPCEKVRGINRQNFIEQNDWNVPTIFHIESKQAKVKNNLRKPKTFDTFYVNWLSGTSPWWAYPYIVAKTINVKMGRYIHNFDEITCRIIMMDFPGRDLIHNIIMKNGLDRSVCKSQQIFFDRKDIIHIP